MKRQYPDNGNRGGPPGASGGSGGGQGGGKRYRVDPYNEALAEGKFELRLLIPTKTAGAVIGKGGEYIKSIREKFEATLTVPDRSTPERVLTILCRQEVLVDCFKEVLMKLAEEQKRGEMELRVLVHQSHAGAIIGRGGSKIKELREETGTHLKVFQDCCPNSSDRVLLISAEQEKLPNAINIVVNFMRQVPIKGVQKPYDAANYDPRAAFSYGGMEDRRMGGGGMPHGGGGRGGRSGPPMMPSPYDAAPFNRGPPAMANYGSAGFGGAGASAGGYGGAPTGGYGGASAGGGYGGAPTGYGVNGGGFGATAGAAGYGAGRPPVGTAPPMGLGAPPHGSYLDVGGNITSTQVTIPNELGGTIIGKGGERINRIRQESGAKIEVGQSTFGLDERIITITGTTHQIQTAQYLLQQTVRASDAGRRYLQEQR